MKDTDYEKDVVEAARLFALHSDCPHWMDDDHYCRRCEDAGRFIPLIKSRDHRIAAQARKEAFEEAAKLIPTTWLDPMLTGPRSLKNMDCATVECFAEAIIKRLEAAAQEKV